MTQKVPLTVGVLGLLLIHGFFGPMSLLVKRHLDLFSRFGTVHARAQQTHRQTTLQL